MRIEARGSFAMFDRKRPIWRSTTLHLLLVGGAVIFALPYAWLLGTSWKLDKEIQSGEVRILPEKPVPMKASPYIDTRTFPEIERPETVERERWDGWMHEQLGQQLLAAVDAFKDDRLIGLPADVVSNELIQGVCHRLRQLLSPAVWQSATQEEFADAVRRQLSDELLAACLDQAYRYFALGQVKLVTEDYQIHDLTGMRPATGIWDVETGPVRLADRTEAGRPIILAHYDLGQAERFVLTSTFTVPCDLADPVKGFKRLELSYRNDQTWHDLRVEIEMVGKRYRAAAPRYMAGDQWAECLYQLPSLDDQRLIPHRYVLLDEVAADPTCDHGPDTMKVRLLFERSGQGEAYWAKASENYRRAFDEVPFWRYFKTSVFLVLANIIGMILSCSLAAYAFARLQWPGRDLCFILVLATMMIPPQVTMIPSFVIYKYLGWYNTLAPLWVPNLLAVNGFGIFLLRQAMKGIPKDLEEAARIDGCGHLRIYWSIVLPLVKPTLAAISIFTFMAVWNDFMTPLIYVNDQRLYPLALGLFSFMVGRENQFTLIMAGSVIMTLPVIITFFLAQRHFIQGVTMSGMKN